MLIDRNMVRGKDIYCTGCGELTEVAIEWHGEVELGENKRWGGGLVLCRKCAQHLMRILLEDIIAYDNGVHVSLINIMYHGQEGQYSLDENKDLRFARFTPRRPLG